MVISNAIRKHGADQFNMIPLVYAFSWNELCVIEKILINEWGTLAPAGYNASEGGEGANGAKHSAEAIERSAAGHRGKPCHPNTRAAARWTHLGVHKSLSHRRAISAAKRGIPRSESTKAKLAAYWAARRANGEFKTDRPYAHASKAKQ